MRRIVHGVRDCRRVTVLRVTFTRGLGDSLDDPVREVVAYYTDEGDLIAEHDPHNEGATP